MSFLRRMAPKTATPPAKPPSVDLAAPVREKQGRTPPEPLSLILPVLAALGAIASIAAIAWVAQDRATDRPRVKRRVDVILKDLETSCLGLAEILRRLKRHGRHFGLDGPAGGAPMKLGLNSTRVDPAAGALYHQMINDVATHLVLATQNSFDAMNAIEDGEIDADDALLDGFADAQEKLNTFIAQRASVRTLTDGSLVVAEQLIGLIHQLKERRTAA